MTFSVRTALADAISPFFKRPPVLQLAALCHRDTERGREVLLITSSHGRWILPKGWPIDGKSGGETALQEAWEEAGVKKGKVTDKPVAVYPTVKRTNDGPELPCQMSVYGVHVKDIANDFPEADRRDRRWVSFDEAQKLVDDEGLRDVLATF